MLLKKQGKVYIADCSFTEKDIAKAAGFWWHPTSCTFSNCLACKEDIVNKWWTSDIKKAAKLIKYANDDLVSELDDINKEKEKLLERSRATCSDIEIPKPNGLEYMPFQKAGINYALRMFGDI